LKAVAMDVFAAIALFWSDRPNPAMRPYHTPYVVRPLRRRWWLQYRCLIKKEAKARFRFEILAGYNNFQGTFLPCLFFWPKTPTLNISPGTVRLPVFAPKTGYGWVGRV
jgi:hypothetical protein